MNINATSKTWELMNEIKIASDSTAVGNPVEISAAQNSPDMLSKKESLTQLSRLEAVRDVSITPDGDILLYLGSSFEDVYKQLSIRFGNTQKRLIIQDSHGDFYFQGRRLPLNKNADYYKFFNIVYHNAADDGFISYQDIQKKLREDYGQATEPDQEIMVKRIRNALTNQANGFFRYAKIQNEAPDKHPIIKSQYGNGIVFHNPEV